MWHSEIGGILIVIFGEHVTGDVEALSFKVLIAHQGVAKYTVHVDVIGDHAKGFELSFSDQPVHQYIIFLIVHVCKILGLKTRFVKASKLHDYFHYKGPAFAAAKSGLLFGIFGLLFTTLEKIPDVFLFLVNLFFACKADNR